MGKQSKVPQPDRAGYINTGIYRRAVGAGATPDPEQQLFDNLPFIDKLQIIHKFLGTKIETLPFSKDSAHGFAQSSPEINAGLDALTAFGALNRLMQGMERFPELENKTVQFALNDALYLGMMLERIYVRAFEPYVATEVSRRKKRGERKKTETRLTEPQWKLVEQFILRRTNAGDSAARACDLVSAQLLTGTFPRLKGQSIEISSKRLQNLWSTRNK